MRETVAYFPGGLVSESHCRNAIGADLENSDQVGDAVGNHLGLAAAGASDNQEGPSVVSTALRLGWTQPFQDFDA